MSTKRQQKQPRLVGRIRVGLHDCEVLSHGIDLERHLDSVYMRSTQHVSCRRLLARRRFETRMQLEHQREADIRNQLDAKKYHERCAAAGSRAGIQNASLLSFANAREPASGV